MGTYEVTVSARFSARHSVALPGGTMEDPHGHDWQVTAAFRADRLDENGFVIDFTAAQAALEEITGEMEGADLNDSPVGEGGDATAERVAEYLAGQLSGRLGRDVHCVRVTESAGCDAAFYPLRQRP
ncbi:MAG: 6-carboxytetrahydropterin synthase [Phycisphaerae bacterium]|nr:6-carboxytetrahydropterin synthase [Phycisphaerae bacterium]